MFFFFTFTIDCHDVLVKAKGIVIEYRNGLKLKTASVSQVAGNYSAKTTLEKVLTINNCTRWIQMYDGIPIYGTVLTTMHDDQGQLPLAVSLLASEYKIKPVATATNAGITAFYY